MTNKSDTTQTPQKPDVNNVMRFEVFPLLYKLYEICAANRLPFVAAVQYKPLWPGNPHETPGLTPALSQQAAYIPTAVNCDALAMLLFDMLFKIPVTQSASMIEGGDKLLNLLAAYRDITHDPTPFAEPCSRCRKQAPSLFAGKCPNCWNLDESERQKFMRLLEMSRDLYGQNGKETVSRFQAWRALVETSIEEARKRENL